MVRPEAHDANTPYQESYWRSHLILWVMATHSDKNKDDTYYELAVRPAIDYFILLE